MQVTTVGLDLASRVNAGVNLHRLAGAKVQQGCKR